MSVGGFVTSEKTRKHGRQKQPVGKEFRKVTAPEEWKGPKWCCQSQDLFETFRGREGEGPPGVERRVVSDRWRKYHE